METELYEKVVLTKKAKLTASMKQSICSIKNTRQSLSRPFTKKSPKALTGLQILRPLSGA
jgi:hypothetical protein